MSDVPNTPGIDLAKSIDLRPGKDPVRERAQVAQLAQEIEAMLMLQMIRGMRQSMLDEASEGEGFGGDTLNDTFDTELTRYLAKVGGMGLGGWLTQHLSADTATEADPTRTSPADTVTVPLNGSARAIPLVDIRALPLPSAAAPASPAAPRCRKYDKFPPLAVGKLTSRLTIFVCPCRSRA